MEYPSEYKFCCLQIVLGYLIYLRVRRKVKKNRKNSKSWNPFLFCTVLLKNFSIYTTFYLTCVVRRKNFSGSRWKFAPRGSFLRRSRIWHYFFDPGPGSRLSGPSKIRLNLPYVWSWTAISPFVWKQTRRGQQHFCRELFTESKLYRVYRARGPQSRDTI